MIGVDQPVLNLSGLLDILRDQPAYQFLLKQLMTGGSLFPNADRQGGEALGLIAAARPFAIAALARDTARPALVITSRLDQAANMAEQLLAWDPSLRVLTYTEPNPLFYERAAWGPRTTRARLRVLAAWAWLQPGAPAEGPLAGVGERFQGEGVVVVTSARALMQRTLPPDFLREHTVVLRRGELIPGGQPDVLLRRWLDLGYEPVTVVTEPGQFSRRGGILDVYPIAADLPARIELWGDEIESLRMFDPATQRSMESLGDIVITPAREALPKFSPDVLAELEDWFDEHTGAGEDEDVTLADDRRGLEQAVAFPALEFYLPWMYGESASLLDYLPSSALVFLDDRQDLADTVEELESQALGLRKTRQEAGSIPPGMPHPLITWDELSDVLSQVAAIDLHSASEEAGRLGGLFTPGPRYGGQLRTVLEDVRKETRGQRDRVILVSRQAERLAELSYEHGGARSKVVDQVTAVPEPGAVLFVRGALGQGWLLETRQGTAHLLTDAEIFGWKRPEPRRRPQRRAIAPEGFFADLEPGDIVVHAEYGIGRFHGLEKRLLSGNEREFLVLAYEGGDRLYVPIHQADRLSRYVGPNDSEPELSRLGTQEWNRVKEKTRADVEKTAAELLELYAARELVSGHAFNPDTPWQHELEASFPYVETEDQLRALSEVKLDMERPRPMDRLIAGDVGYGKTEVALRAAFKAVMDGKQVAILVPTTVLAQQHLETFTRRLAAFPMRVEMLSRFRSRQEQQEVIKGLEQGSVDIVIGTHRLLGADVKFKDLGLLIIDEEQRFGVTHKEKLKQMRTEVDVLTLTATPIPRTLYMSLTGVRDISTINTPPEERLPVVTFVGRRDDNLIRQAILRELDRGGQVFFVHNRVQSIYAEAERLQDIVPEARIGVAHGQMAEHELEAVMERFSEAEIDVLVSTSIIEAGLDIPNANTLVVDRADHFGLSQLYQLRGRVGRSATRAYAYLFHPPLHGLTEEARARLETIAEQTQLGAGMNIAMRDLEIRGAGDILGTRQHGVIAAVGFHLYTRMLSQAVQRLRAGRDGGAPSTGEQPAVPREVVTIDLPIPTYIPTDFLPDMGLRIQLYRRLADVSSEQAIDDLGVELADRFGPLPPPVENLLFQLRVKLLALRADVEAVTTDGDQIAIRMPGLAHLDRPSLQRWLAHDVRVSRTAIWLPHRQESDQWRADLLQVLALLAERRLGRESGRIKQQA